jgi:hypothetical protein
MTGEKRLDIGYQVFECLVTGVRWSILQSSVTMTECRTKEKVNLRVCVTALNDDNRLLAWNRQTGLTGE